jgi:hypothetical protein
MAAVCSTDTPVSVIVPLIIDHELLVPVTTSAIPVSTKVLVELVSDFTTDPSKIGVIVKAPLRTIQYIHAIPSINTNKYLNLNFIVVVGKYIKKTIPFFNPLIL